MTVHSEPFASRLVGILLELHKTQRSAVVRLERGSDKKQFVIVNGLLAFAESNLPPEHLAQVLMKLDLLPRKDLKLISTHMKGGKSSDEAIMLATGLDGVILENGMREQALSILASAFSWATCEIRLFSGGDRIHRRCTLSLPLPSFLLEAARRAVQERKIPASIRSIKGLIHAIPGCDNHVCIPLNRSEAGAYALVTGPMQTHQLLPLISSEKLSPEQVIQCLLLLGLLRLEDAPEDTDHTRGQIAFRVEELLRRYEVSNLYEILSVSPDAEDADIRTAYHELAMLYHPDRFQSKVYSTDFRSKVDKLFTFITGAYSTLSDPASRSSYDDSRKKSESKVEAALQSRATTDLDKAKAAETLFRAGRAALIKGDHETAASHFSECVWLNPETARYQHFLGVAQMEIAQLRKEAEGHLLKAIALDKARVDSYLELGRLYLKANLPKRAETQFYEVLRWDPDNPVALRMLKVADGGERKFGEKRQWE